MGKKLNTFKWVMLALMLVSLLVVILGWLKGFPEHPVDDNGSVDPLLYWTYFMVGAATLSAIGVSVFIMAKNNPNSLKKLGLVLGGAVALILIAYVLAAGSQPVAYNGEPVTKGTLKLTDTILIITAIAGIGAVLSIIGGEIWNKIRNK